MALWRLGTVCHESRRVRLWLSSCYVIESPVAVVGVLANYIICGSHDFEDYSSIDANSSS